MACFSYHRSVEEASRGSVLKDVRVYWGKKMNERDHFRFSVLTLPAHYFRFLLYLIRRLPAD
jgi:hypothetical protein